VKKYRLHRHLSNPISGKNPLFLEKGFFLKIQMISPGRFPVFSSRFSAKKSLPDPSPPTGFRAAPRIPARLAADTLG
jgi:hypothetical protein